MQKLRWDDALTLMSPHPYALVSTIDAQGRPNLMGVAWFSVVSWQPQMIAVAIGHGRYTRQCLDHCPEFALCIPSVEVAEGAWLCGCESGRDTNKWEKGGFKPVPSETIKPPIFEGALVAFECRVAQKVVCGDHILYIGEVLAIRGEPEKRLHMYTIHYRRPVAIDKDLNVRKDLGLSR